MSRALLKPIPDWLALRVACVMLSSLRPGEEPFEGPLPNFIANRRLHFVPQGFFVTINSQDVVDTTDPQTLSEKGKFRLRVLAELNALMHGANDVCVAGKLVGDELL